MIRAARPMRRARQAAERRENGNTMSNENNLRNFSIAQLRRQIVNNGFKLPTNIKEVYGDLSIQINEEARQNYRHIQLRPILQSWLSLRQGSGPGCSKEI
jgi:hypothetical protein